MDPPQNNRGPPADNPQAPAALNDLDRLTEWMHVQTRAPYHVIGAPLPPEPLPEEFPRPTTEDMAELARSSNVVDMVWFHHYLQREQYFRLLDVFLHRAHLSFRELCIQYRLMHLEAQLVVADPGTELRGEGSWIHVGDDIWMRV